MIEPHLAHRRNNGLQDGVQPMIELLQVLVEGQAQLAEMQQQVHSMVERMIKAIEAQAKPTEAPPAPTPKIATYEEMYGLIPEPPPVALSPLPPSRRCWLVRWLVKEA